MYIRRPSSPVHVSVWSCSVESGLSVDRKSFQLLGNPARYIGMASSLRRGVVCIYLTFTLRNTVALNPLPFSPTRNTDPHVTQVA